MEIVTYVREGAVAHRDSTGNVGITSAGDVQVMSAGTGIRHAEHNQGRKPLRLFQIWLRPNRQGVRPRWGTRTFPKEDRANQFIVLASGLPGHAQALPIHADACVLGATLLAGAQLTHTLDGFRHAYLAPARGTVRVNGQRLRTGDGLAASDETWLVIEAEEDAEVVLVVAR